MKKTKIYFASDQHFGAPNFKESKKREKLFVQWLEEIKKDAKALFLLGDLFDFWFEYDKVIPKGFVRVLGKLSELSDAGLPIYFFVGNHDLWMKDYFEKEMNIEVFHRPQIFEFFGKRLYLAHGDGLGPKDYAYKIMNFFFKNTFLKWLFKWLHPDLGVRLAQFLSLKNKLLSGKKENIFLGKDKEWLVQYALRQMKKNYDLGKRNCDYFVFGHRHLPKKINLKYQNLKSVYLNIGDWIQHFTYGILDSENFLIKKWEIKNEKY